METRWTVPDFILVILGGLLGGLVFTVPIAVWGEQEFLVVLAIVGQFLGHLIVLWLVARTRGLTMESLGLDIRGTDLAWVGAGVLLQIILAVVFTPLQELLVPDGNAQDVASVLSSLQSPIVRIAAVMATTLIAPVTEELMFRGVLLRSFVDRSRNYALVVTALVFAGFHLIGVASVNAGILVFAQIFLVGLVLAFVTLKYDRLGPATFIHGGFNLVAAIVLLLPEQILEQATQGG